MCEQNSFMFMGQSLPGGERSQEMRVELPLFQKETGSSRSAGVPVLCASLTRRISRDTSSRVSAPQGGSGVSVGAASALTMDSSKAVHHQTVSLVNSSPQPETRVCSKSPLSASLDWTQSSPSEGLLIRTKRKGTVSLKKHCIMGKPEKENKGT